jgi:hypothetical protein
MIVGVTAVVCNWVRESRHMTDAQNDNIEAKTRSLLWKEMLLEGANRYQITRDPARASLR